MIQYCHSKMRYNQYSQQFKNKTGTIAVQMPDKKNLFEALQMQATSLLLPIGVSILSYEDKFCKATGRVVAESKIESRLCRINTVEVRRCGLQNKYIYHLECEVPDPKRSNKQFLVNFGISTTHDSEESRLVYVDYSSK